ncbi:MAG: hypothetical protein N2039_05065 [Gemmataceae bacterium]|nr:hypothetical protein [Gemmataceae bacterium]
MISPEALQWLRCPIDPERNARLVDEETHLRCEHCGVRFRIQDGVPNLLVDEAELPPGCRQLADLPCRRSPSG